jgi:hypothetical protein
MLHDQTRAACPCPCCMSMSILHVHVHTACPCPCCMSMSMLHVHVNAACPCQCSMSMSIFMYIYIEMPECQTVWHLVSPVPDWKKLMMPEQVWYRTKLTQSGIFLVPYRTKIWDAGMLTPALVSSMLTPSYDLAPPFSLYIRAELGCCKADLNTCTRRSWKNRW